MIPYISFLRKSRVIIIDLLSDEIRSDELSENLSQLRIVLKSGIVIYIKYNEYREDEYQILDELKKAVLS